MQRETDQRFHWTIAEAAGNPRRLRADRLVASGSAAALKDLIAPAIVEAVAREQHREIIAAIEAGEPALAERAMRAHLRYLTDLLETVAPRNPTDPRRLIPQGWAEVAQPRDRCPACPRPDGP